MSKKTRSIETSSLDMPMQMVNQHGHPCNDHELLRYTADRLPIDVVAKYALEVLMAASFRELVGEGDMTIDREWNYVVYDPAVLAKAQQAYDDGQLPRPVVLGKDGTHRPVGHEVIRTALRRADERASKPVAEIDYKATFARNDSIGRAASAEFRKANADASIQGMLRAADRKVELFRRAQEETKVAPKKKRKA